MTYRCPLCKRTFTADTPPTSPRPRRSRRRCSGRGRGGRRRRPRHHPRLDGCSELSEALEDFRGGHAPFETWYEDAIIGMGATTHEPFSQVVGGVRVANKPCGIPSELADIVIRIMHFSHRHGIDLGKAMREKMAYNETRPFKHGMKKI